MDWIKSRLAENSTRTALIAIFGGLLAWGGGAIGPEALLSTVLASGIAIVTPNNPAKAAIAALALLGLVGLSACAGGAGVAGIVAGVGTAASMASTANSAAQITESVVCGAYGGYYADEQAGKITTPASLSGVEEAVAVFCSGGPAVGSTALGTVLDLWGKVQQLQAAYSATATPAAPPKAT